MFFLIQPTTAAMFVPTTTAAMLSHINNNNNKDQLILTGQITQQQQSVSVSASPLLHWCVAAPSQALCVVMVMALAPLLLGPVTVKHPRTRK